jgi:hypothetical protein
VSKCTSLSNPHAEHSARHFHLSTIATQRLWWQELDYYEVGVTTLLIRGFDFVEDAIASSIAMQAAISAW